RAPARRAGAWRRVIRPEAVSLGPDAAGSAVGRDRQYFGHDQLVTVGLANGTTLRARLGPSPYLQPGDVVSVAVSEVSTFPLTAQAADEAPQPVRTDR